MNPPLPHKQPDQPRARAKREPDRRDDERLAATRAAPAPPNSELRTPNSVQGRDEPDRRRLLARPALVSPSGTNHLYVWERGRPAHSVAAVCDRRTALIERRYRGGVAHDALDDFLVLDPPVDLAEARVRLHARRFRLEPQRPLLIRQALLLDLDDLAVLVVRHARVGHHGSTLRFLSSSQFSVFSFQFSG